MSSLWRKHYRALWIWLGLAWLSVASFFSLADEFYGATRPFLCHMSRFSAFTFFFASPAIWILAYILLESRLQLTGTKRLSIQRVGVALALLIVVSAVSLILLDVDYRLSWSFYCMDRPFDASP